MLCRKNLSPQLVAVLCSWWCCSSKEVRLGHVTSDRCISVDRGVQQGACESPLVFVMVADEILDGLRPSWERRNFAWSCDEVSLSLGVFAQMCVAPFVAWRPRSEPVMFVGLDKTHWSSSIGMNGENLAVRDQSVVWERKLEFILSVIEPGAHSGGSVRHRSQNSSSVFCKWKPLFSIRTCR